MRRFGAHSIVGWNSRPGKARQAAGTQPWSRSREVGVKRRQRSARAAMRKREVIEHRNTYKAEADVFSATAGSNAQTIGKDAQVPPGLESVASAQGTVCIPGRPDAFRKRYATLSSQRSGGKQTTRQESDWPILATKPVKAGGAKGSASGR